MTHSAINGVVFDVGGVLVQLDFPRMIATLATESRRPLADIDALFRPEHGPGGSRFGNLFGRATVGEIGETEILEELMRETGLPEHRLREIYSMLLPARIDEVLSLFSQLRVPIGILSNTNALGWRRVEELLPELAMVEHVVLSYEVTLAKPNPAIFGVLASRFRCGVGNLCFIDDSAENVAAARRCGLHAIQFDRSEPASLQVLVERLKELELLSPPEMFRAT